MFYYNSGNINHFDHRFLECGRAIHLNHYMNGLHDEPFFTDLVLVGNIDGTATSANAGGPAIHSPKDNEYWFVSGMHGACCAPQCLTAKARRLSRRHPWASASASLA